MEKFKNKYENDTYLAQWLSGDISDDSLKAIVGEDEFLLYKKVVKGIDVDTKLNQSTNHIFNKIQDKIHNTKDVKVKSFNTYWYIGIAASLVLLFGLFNFFSTNESTYTTGYGDYKTVTLIDGSEVILNSNSTLTYNEDNWEKERLIQLEGEAYFKVAKGKKFTVQTPNGSVAVLGTEFKVNSFKNYFNAFCYEGKVMTDVNDKKHILTPSKGIKRIGDENTELYSTKDVSPSWLNDESKFKGVPLKYVIVALNNQYGKEFITDGIDDTLLFTGSFPHNNLNLALKTVFDTFGIKYTHKENSKIKLLYK